MSVAVRVFIGLLAGLGLGVLVHSRPEYAWLVGFVEPVGQVWVNALRMAVIPLVVSCLIVSVGSSHDPAGLVRLGRRALVLFPVLLTAASVFTAAIAAPLLARLDVDPATLGALRGSYSDPAPDRMGTSLQPWIVQLVPANPIEAAADGRMLPLIVFALLLGLAVRRAGEEPGQAVLAFFHGIAEAMFVLVRWVLVLAPVGVFALAVPLATRAGPTVLGPLAFYVSLVLGLMVLFSLLVLYPVAVLAGGVSLRQFVQGTAPAQAVAFSSRSSLACLPAMIEGARTRLGLSEEVTVLLVPVAGSLFRIGSAIAQTAGVMFIARLDGVVIDAPRMGAVIATIVLTTFSVPGIPGGSILAMAPALLAAGLPVSGIGLLLAVDAIPDMFRTMANVTGGMTAAVVLGHHIETERAPDRYVA